MRAKGAFHAAPIYATRAGGHCGGLAQRDHPRLLRTISVALSSDRIRPILRCTLQDVM